VTACPESWRERRVMLSDSMKYFATERMILMAYFIESKRNFNDIEKHHRKRFPTYI
jgi:hypothetical protein